MNEQTDDKLIRNAQRLRGEIAPQRDLWPGIEAAISEAPSGRRRVTPLFAQAAAVLLLVGATSTLTWFVARQDVSQPVTVIQPELIFDQVAFGADYNLGPDFTDARSAVASNLDEELDRLPAEDRAEVEENLAVIRQAIADINAALEQDPDNAMLQELLLRTYREELTVMQQVGGLTQDVLPRNDI